ncbi:unnamed protein product [Coregonus sp. 'balchen']|nr:unnamed protein product [Coregonus sp. 'balchen']
MEEAYDITFYIEEMYDATVERVKDGAGERPMSFFNITCFARSNYWTSNVHMYNPHVTDIAVAAFLGRYCDVTSGARPDQGGFEGFLHLPAIFSLGAERGMLFYARQPPFCRMCREYGHAKASCGPKECHGCGNWQHLFQDCHARQRSYAAADAGGKAAGGPDVGDGERRRGRDAGPRAAEPARKEPNVAPERPSPPSPTPCSKARKEPTSASSGVIPEMPATKQGAPGRPS